MTNTNPHFDRHMTESNLFPKPMPISICIPAYNEEKLISRAIQYALEVQSPPVSEVLVCANGCTDGTVAIVKELQNRYPIVRLLEESKASKIAAWNRLIREALSDYLVFLDADVRIDPDSVEMLVHKLFTEAVVLATGIQIPEYKGLSSASKLFGFIMMPMSQDYVYGGFYACNRPWLLQQFRSHGLKQMPKAMSEDIFLTLLLDREQIGVVTEAKAWFRPPSRAELIHYFARVEAQLIDLERYFPHFYKKYRQERFLNRSLFFQFREKLKESRWKASTLAGAFSALGKKIFSNIYKNEIDKAVFELLKITDSDKIMSELTRSETSRKSIE
jgi:glycosyltransferase involved in cell wall biosynthesis